jgi:hypothetical protein
MEVRLERYLVASAAKDPARVVRDKQGRALLVREDALDRESLHRDGIALLQLAQRIKFQDGGADESWLAPRELTEIAKEKSTDADGVVTPLGKTEVQKGLWLKYAPGIEYVGKTDRGEVLLRRRADKDVSRGPVENSANTRITGRTKRLVTRLDDPSHRRDIAEAEAWLKAFQLLDPASVKEVRFLCAGISYAQKGNVAYLTRTAEVNFFSPEDPDMRKLQKDIQDRFAKVGRKHVPSVRVLSLLDVPEDDAQLAAFRKKVDARGRVEGLPSKIADSVFYDAEDKKITPANFVRFAPLLEIADEITILTINTDYHGEVKSRGVLSPLMAIMSLIDVISAHAGSGVLNRRGEATLFTGPTGTGKTTATSFFAERNEHFRREELRRRYQILLQKKDKLSGESLTRKLDEMLPKIGILCQEDWVEIARAGGAGGSQTPQARSSQWEFWPTERSLYARTGGFPGLKFILMENKPLVENAYADLGASGKLEDLGTITHDYFPARLFYQPEWGHLLYDRSPRKITANVFLERNKALDFIIRRVTTDEALTWLLHGRTPEGKYEPLYNAYPDFSGLLITLGVVGDKLTDAYKKAIEGDTGPLGKGDVQIGKRIFEKLDKQMKLWRELMDVTPTFIVNGAPGLEITQDANWVVSEEPAVVGPPGSQMSTEKFKQYMKDEFGVTYGEKGQWTHVAR